ncbi:MAG TPA: hypothetical protein VII38_09965, partial [Polyangia bacterium]
ARAQPTPPASAASSPQNDANASKPAASDDAGASNSAAKSGVSADSASPTGAPAPGASGDPAALRQAVDALGRKVDDADRQIAAQSSELARLRRDLDAESAARARAEEEARKLAASGALFHLGRFAVSLSGFLQADGVLYDQASQDEINWSTGQPLNESRFLIRRGRLRVEAEYGIASGLIEFDANTVNGPVARISAGEVSVKWPAHDPSAPPYVMASIGLMRIPFGFEVLQKDYVRLFLERSNVMRALFPGEFDLGIRVQGGWRFLRYAIAAMNGNPAGDKQFALRDPNQSKDLVGRVGIETRLLSRLGLSGGISGVYGTGFSQGSGPTKDVIVWHDTNLDGQVDPTELTALPGRPAVPSQTFTRYALGGDLQVALDVPRLGALLLYGEVVWATNLDRGLLPADPVGAGRDLREFGWYAGFTQELTRYALVGVRYDRYDPDSDARDQQGANLVPKDLTFSTLAVAVAGGWPPYVRFTLEYDHNTNALGRTPSGMVTTLGADVITLRGQVRY